MLFRSWNTFESFILFGFFLLVVCSTIKHLVGNRFYSLLSWWIWRTEMPLYFSISFSFSIIKLCVLDACVRYVTFNKCIWLHFDLMAFFFLFKILQLRSGPRRTTMLHVNRPFRWMLIVSEWRSMHSMSPAKCVINYCYDHVHVYHWNGTISELLNAPNNRGYDPACRFRNAHCRWFVMAMAARAVRYWDCYWMNSRGNIQEAETLQANNHQCR